MCASFLMQAQDPVSIHLSEKDGLPGKEFYDLIEDDKGFVWLCADKGLFRYDGKKFKNYSNTKQLGLSVFNAKKDNLGRIWCNNISGQFFYVQNDKLHLFTDLSKQLKGELVDFVVKTKYLWVFSARQIYKINLKTKEVDFSYNSKNGYGVPFKFNETIYFGNLDSISSITLKNKRKRILATNLTLRDEKGKVIAQGKAKIFKIKSSLFFLQSRLHINTFFEFNVSKKSFSTIKGFEKVAKARIYNHFENDNEIWLATSSGVWVYEFMGTHFKLKKRFLKDKDVSEIIKDKDDNYWFTTLNNGVYIVPNIFIETCTISEENKNINSLDKINDSTLVFGTANGNISFYNTITSTEKTINLPTKHSVSTLKYHPNKNMVFISKDDNGYTLNYNTLQLTKINYFQTAKSISILENNDLLYTNHSNVFFLQNADFSKEKKFISNRKRTYASHYNKTNKMVYIAFVDNLVKYDSSWNPTVIRYKNKPIYGNSITKTTNGVIWVATFKNGIFGIKNDIVIAHFTTENGLTANNIQKIKADQNKLWIALGNSIQVLDVTTKQLKTLTRREGIVSYNISGIEIIKNKIYFSSNEGLFSVDKQKSFKIQNPEVYFNTIEINEKDTLITSNYELKYDQNAIKIGFNVNGFLFNQKGKYKYRLKGFNNHWLITDIGVNSVKYSSLPTGAYTFQVQPVIDSLVTTDLSKIKELKFLIKRPFWETWWFILGVSVLIFGSTILYFRKKIQIKEKERVTQLEKISLEKELVAINLTALRSQMNPHFIFNALNSIQDLILKEDTDASYDYIVMFAELVRNTLSYSSQDFISIEKELDFLKVYLQLEKLRFGETFNYTISFDGKDNLEIPSLLIQPFIENALVHGLLHKADEKKELDIVFCFKENTLQCIVTDNGIGRKKAAEIASRQGNNHESFALRAIEKRLKIFRKQYNETIGYVIEDLYENEEVKGTKVIVTMPFKIKF